MEKIMDFLNANWKAIVDWFDKLWKFCKETILKDDSIWNDLTEKAE